MKKLIPLLLAVIFLTGCAAAPEKDPFKENIVESTNMPEEIIMHSNQIITAFPLGQHTVSVKAVIKEPRDKKDFFIYRPAGKYTLKCSDIYEIFPQLSNHLKSDATGYLLECTYYKDGIMASINEKFARISIREHEKYEDRNESNEDIFGEPTDFNLTVDEIQDLALNTVKKLFGTENICPVITRITCMGKKTDSPYYEILLDFECDGLLLSDMGRRVSAGKDNEGYEIFLQSRTSSDATVIIDREGICEISWSFEDLEKSTLTKTVISPQETIEALAKQAVISDFLYEDKATKQNKTYKVTEMELVYGGDFVSIKEPKTSEILLKPCRRIKLESDHGSTKYILTDASNGEVLSATISVRKG